MILHVLFGAIVADSIKATLFLPTSEYSALQELFDNTQGLQWRWVIPYNLANGYPWNFTNPYFSNPCNASFPWQGVKCVTQGLSSHVSQLQLPSYQLTDLNSNNLVGSLPSSFTSLYNLETVYLAGNMLNGSIPTDIGNLINLVSLDLSMNCLSGILPKSLTTIPNLEYLYAYDNNLHGSIPETIGNLSFLIGLDLESNYLTGTIPESIGNLKKLQLLYLFNNELAGLIPHTIENLSDMITLALYNNYLTGTIPYQIGKLSKLQLLFLHNNQLHGSIPDTIGYLTQLIYFMAYNNQLTNSIPDSIGQLQSLQYLFLYNNQLQGSLPSTIGNATQLINLQLSSNEFTGPIPVSIGQLQSLQYLFLYNNQLYGNIPDSIGNLTQLINLQLFSNDITGSIPVSIGQLHSLVKLGLSYNHLNGTLPECLFSLSTLQVLYLNDNTIHGSIPQNIGKINGSLIDLQLSNNVLTGSIPNNIVNLTQLQVLYLFNNLLQGSIPPEIGKLSELQYLGLYDNVLTGIIPNSIVNLTDLQLLYLYNNVLHGTIPYMIGNLSNLTYLALDHNELTGSIPNSICQLSNLQVIYLNNNLLHGTIPQEIGYLTQLAFLLFNNNGLTGIIPHSITKLINLQILRLYTNQLSRTIPSNLGDNMIYFIEISLYENNFTGYLPNSSTHIQSFDVSMNWLSGTIPYSLFQSNLVFFCIANNVLSGTISDKMIHNALYLQQLDISYNYFTGSFLPSSSNSNDNNDSNDSNDSRVQLKNLKILQLSSNAFTDSLPFTILPASLQIVYLHDNQFSGSIPTTWFNQINNNLTVLIMAINCLTGTIPINICNNIHLSQLSLDGLHTSPYCEEKIFPWLDTSGYYSTTTAGEVSGTLPDCLFTLPQLTQLQVSGNALTGTIPNLIPAVMNTLILGSNYFSGTIPSLLWNSKTLKIVDLSFNKFRDILPSSSPSSLPLTSSYSMQVNRLSGSIPSYFLTMSNITMLEGNHFSCKLNRNDLPYNDPEIQSYECGSDTSNAALVIWGILFFLIVFIFALFYLIRKQQQQQQQWDNTTAITSDHHFVIMIRQWLYQYNLVFLPLVQANDNNDETNKIHYYQLQTSVIGLKETAKILSLLLSTSWYCVIFALCIISPISIALNQMYSMRIYNYVWNVSSVTLTGLIPAMVMLVLWCLLLTFLSWTVYDTVGNHWLLSLCNIPKKHSSSSSTSNEEPSFASIQTDNVATDLSSKQVQKEQQSSSWMVMWFCYGCILLLNVVIVVIVNFSYVYAAANSRYNQSTMIILSLLLSLFKLLWNGIIQQSITLHRFIFIRYSATMLTMIVLFNNVIVPYLADIFYSPDCFLYAITRPPSIVVSWTEYACNIAYHESIYTTGITNTSEQVECIADNIKTTLYYPTFHYSYQCSASLLSLFASVFIYRYILSGILYPLWIGFLVWSSHYWAFWTKEKNGWLYWGVIWTIPTLWRILLTATKKLERRSQQQKLQPWEIETERMTIEMEEKAKEIEHDKAEEMIKELLQQLQCYVKDSTFLVNQLCLEVITSVAMMMSFGMLFPPLLFVIAVSLFTHISLHRMLMGTWIDLIDIITSNTSKCINPLHSVHLFQAFFDSLLTFDHQWLEFEITCQNGLIAIFFLTSWIWSFTLFDTLGDAVGAMQAYWIVLVMCLYPIVLFVWIVGLNRWKERIVAASSDADSNESEETSVEEETEMMNIQGEMTLENDPHSDSASHKRIDVENPLQSPYITSPIQ